MDKQELSVWMGSQVAPVGAIVPQRELLLVRLLVDDSGSIESAGNTQAVIDGYNSFLEVLRDSPSDVRVSRWFLNSRLGGGRSFRRPADSPLLSREIYQPGPCTPLFARSVESLESVLEAARQAVEQGYIVRTMTFIFTDGADNASGGVTAVSVRNIVNAMLSTGTHIVGACAVNDGCTNFWQVFAEMGIPERWVKVLKSDHREIRRSFRQMGAMASHSSMGGDSFTEVSETGFGPA